MPAYPQCASDQRHVRTLLGSWDLQCHAVALVIEVEVSSARAHAKQEAHRLILAGFNDSEFGGVGACFRLALDQGGMAAVCLGDRDSS